MGAREFVESARDREDGGQRNEDGNSFVWEEEEISVGEEVGGVGQAGRRRRVGR